MTYTPPIDDHRFLLRHVLKVEALGDLPGFDLPSHELIDQILDGAARLAKDVLAPLNAVGDRQGCHWHADHRVTTPDGFSAAYAKVVEGGWPTLAVDPRYGGQGLPKLIGLLFTEYASSANMAFGIYLGLTHGALLAIEAAGSEEQKAAYLPKMAAGTWAGSMNLTEPHAGTDLGLLRTRAEPQADGSYRISGQKIWISGGEHDLTENIVHLVLARATDSPPGTGGISLFIVPKFIPREDGSPRARNGVACVGLETKMGLHGNATCAMSFDGATGWLLGEKNRGLNSMFVMMNYERLGAGLQGLGQAEASYQAAVRFARERLQGRALTGAQNPDGPADPIIVHPDVRRMLMDSRSFIEGGRALLYWSALHLDLAEVAKTEAERKRSHAYTALITPVVKAFLTDRGFDACSDALQVHGGSGYTEHFPVSQYLRDARIAKIYEGTSGVQALDLILRKLPAAGGAAIEELLSEMSGFVADQTGNADLGDFVRGLEEASALLRDGAAWAIANARSAPEDVAGGAVDFLHLFGLTMLAYMWALMAQAALASDDRERPFNVAKLITGRHFLARLLPEAKLRHANMKAGAATMMALSADAF